MIEYSVLFCLRIHSFIDLNRRWKFLHTSDNLLAIIMGLHWHTHTHDGFKIYNRFVDCCMRMTHVWIYSIIIIIIWCREVSVRNGRCWRCLQLKFDILLSTAKQLNHCPLFSVYTSTCAQIYIIHFGPVSNPLLVQKNHNIVLGCGRHTTTRHCLPNSMESRNASFIVMTMTTNLESNKCACTVFFLFFAPISSSHRKIISDYLFDFSIHAHSCIPTVFNRTLAEVKVISNVYIINMVVASSAKTQQSISNVRAPRSKILRAKHEK